MRSFATASVAALVVLASGCGPSPAPGGALDTRSSDLISDQVHGSGTPGFYFLFPMVSPPKTTGVFQRGLHPVVRIEELSPGTRGTIATYSTSAGPYGDRVFEFFDSYDVLWPTAPFHLSADLTYRIHVSVQGLELGFADVDVVKRLSDLRKVDTGEYVPLLDDLILPIRFRIEAAALRCAGVVCAAADQCHLAGVCDPHTGACSSPAKADGAACDDGNACTRTDTCQAGVCAGSDAVHCLPPDACHDLGACDPATGLCVNPPKPDGAQCDDANRCTAADTCQAGLCIGGAPVTCPPPAACHAPGVCEPLTGACASAALDDGAACDDGNACTRSDTCQGGSCVGQSPVVCAASDACHLAGTCAPATGACSNPPAADGTACDDGNACTHGDTCRAGLCSAGAPVVCSSACGAGTCDPATGACTAPVCAVQVATVPWNPAIPGLPHPIASGVATTLKGVARGATQYYWDYGDGTNTGWLAISDPSNLGAQHTYFGPAGRGIYAVLFARRTPQDIPAQALYPIQIGAVSSSVDPTVGDPRTAMAIDEGLWYLHTSLARLAFGAGAPGYGQQYGSWSAPLRDDCAALEAFGRHGSRVTGDPAADPYAEDVQRVLARVLAQARVAATGVFFSNSGAESDGAVIETSGVCGLALSKSGAHDYLAPTGVSGVYGLALGDLAQSAVQFLASSQLGAGGLPPGAWPNAPGSAYDEPSTTWAAHALLAYESDLGATIPSTVVSGLRGLLTRSRSTAGASCGGFAVAPYPYSLGSAAGGLLEQRLAGATLADVPPRAAIGYAYTYWNQGGPAPQEGWVVPANGELRTAYWLAGALRAFGSPPLTAWACDGTDTGASADWFSGAAPREGLASYLVRTRAPNGSWSDAAGSSFSSLAQATGWAVSTLLGDGVAVPPNAVICDCANQTWDTNQDITLLGGCSTEPDPARHIVRMEWDFSYDAAAGFQAEATGDEVVKVGGYPNYGSQPVALRVTDDNPRGAQHSVAVCNVVIKPPPHCPHPDAGGGLQHVYDATAGVPVKLDASGSFDPDHDPLTFNWSLSGDGLYGDATGSKPSFTYAAPGTYQVAVQVTDHPSLNVQPYVAAECTQTSFATVVVTAP